MHDLYSASACSKLASWFLQHKDTEGLEKLGGPEGLAKALRTDLDEGLNPEATDDTAIQRRRQLFGANKFPQVPLKSFFALLWGNLSDKILILLMVAATVRPSINSARIRSMTTFSEALL